MKYPCKTIFKLTFIQKKELKFLAEYFRKPQSEILRLMISATYRSILEDV